MADEERDLSALEAAAAERRYWRDLSELDGDDEALLDEFPPGASEPDFSLTRRHFLGLAGASAALLGVGCGRPPREPILPYVKEPQEVIPGLPLHFATSMSLGGYATGLVVESHTGRPIKIDGNPDHPASLGGTSPMHQAWVLQLYDPDRAKSLRQGLVPRDWSSFVRAFNPNEPGSTLDDEQGRGLRFLLEPTSSPLLAHQIEQIRTRYPLARVYFHEPFSRQRAWEGARLAFGQVLEPHVDLSKAAVVASLDADFLASGPFHLRNSRRFMLRRRPRPGSEESNRLYVVEDTLSLTGARADHRLAIRSSELRAFAQALLGEVLRRSPTPLGDIPASVRSAALTWRALPEHRRFVQVLARDLWAHRGESVVLVGDQQPPEVQAIVHAINSVLGNFGSTVSMMPSPIVDAGGDAHELSELTAELERGRVQTLVMLEGNPAYTSAADEGLRAALRRAPQRVYLSYYEDETAEDATWFIPAAHGLESWGDARAYDGTISFVQPLIEPIFPGKTVSEALAVFLGEGHKSSYALLRQFWESQGPRDTTVPLDTFWQEALRQGFLPQSAYPEESAPVRWDLLEAVLPQMPAPETDAREGIEVSFRPDLKLYDGRFANNAWLMELPDPITKVSWDNAALVSPDTARQLGVETEQLVRIATEHAALQVPVVVLPGQADGVVTLPAGWGRQGALRVANGVGFSVYRVRPRAAPRFLSGAQVTPLKGSYPLAMTQTHWRMHGRPVVIDLPLAHYKALPDPLLELNDPPRHSLYALPLLAEQQWGMAVDTMTCIGCEACVVSCQAENNIPTVGKVGVRKGREMHWLRIDRYFVGDVDKPRVLFQPMLCQHCEMAPCEYVCPVYATTHSPDGLNEMTYNRCVGTRDCETNCPYKVRRFNFFDYWRDVTPLEQLVMNPDLTVRARGVIEKCTFCVQRIRTAQIQARMENRPLGPNEVRTACQEACPTDAIIFGDLSADSRVNAMTKDKRAYGVLKDRGTRPRVRYLATLWNEADALATSPGEEE